MGGCRDTMYAGIRSCRYDVAGIALSAGPATIGIRVQLTARAAGSRAVFAQGRAERRAAAVALDLRAGAPRYPRLGAVAAAVVHDHAERHAGGGQRQQERQRRDAPRHCRQLLRGDAHSNNARAARLISDWQLLATVGEIPVNMCNCTAAPSSSSFKSVRGRCARQALRSPHVKDLSASCSSARTVASGGRCLWSGREASGGRAHLQACRARRAAKLLVCARVLCTREDEYSITGMDAF